MSWTKKPEPLYRITPNAKHDMVKIGEYTKRYWGKRQRNQYLKSLEKRFEWLAEHPLSGKHRVDIEEGYYSFPHGQHVVFYLISGNMIDIIGVPHQEMDIITYFRSV